MSAESADAATCGDRISMLWLNPVRAASPKAIRGDRYLETVYNPDWLAAQGGKGAA